MTLTPKIVFYSSVTNMTEKFVDKLGYDKTRIYSKNDEITKPSILIVPTYGSTPPEGGKTNAVPVIVKKFLANETNRSNIIGVIGTGNINFGPDYCRAAYEISAKLRIPMLGKVELTGTETDARELKDKIDEFYSSDAEKFIGWPKQIEVTQNP